MTEEPEQGYNATAELERIRELYNSLIALAQIGKLDPMEAATLMGELVGKLLKLDKMLSKGEAYPMQWTLDYGMDESQDEDD